MQQPGLHPSLFNIEQMLKSLQREGKATAFLQPVWNPRTGAPYRRPTICTACTGYAPFEEPTSDHGRCPVCFVQLVRPEICIKDISHKVSTENSFKGKVAVGVLVPDTFMYYLLHQRTGTQPYAFVDWPDPKKSPLYIGDLDVSFPSLEEPWIPRSLPYPVPLARTEIGKLGMQTLFDQFPKIKSIDRAFESLPVLLPEEEEHMTCKQTPCAWPLPLCCTCGKPVHPSAWRLCGFTEGIFKTQPTHTWARFYRCGTVLKVVTWGDGDEI